MGRLLSVTAHTLSSMYIHVGTGLNFDNLFAILTVDQFPSFRSMSSVHCVLVSCLLFSFLLSCLFSALFPFSQIGVPEPQGVGHQEPCRCVQGRYSLASGDSAMIQQHVQAPAFFK